MLAKRRPTWKRQGAHCHGNTTQTFQGHLRQERDAAIKEAEAQQASSQRAKSQAIRDQMELQAEVNSLRRQKEAACKDRDEAIQAANKERDAAIQDKAGFPRAHAAANSKKIGAFLPGEGSRVRGEAVRCPIRKSYQMREA